jgi:transcriptional regulator with XRE-family HTH domain
MFGQFLTELINKYGQGTLADKAGTDGSTISRFRSGQGGLTIGTLEKLLEIGGAVICSRGYIMKIEDAFDTATDLWKRERRKRFEDLELIVPEKGI